MTTDPRSYVYCPSSQLTTDEAECRALLADVGAALWITGDGVPSATLLPTAWEGNHLLAHASAHNEQFPLSDEAVPCRVVVQGSDAYISPRWYPSVQSAEHGGKARGRAEGRAVGTWNYRQVQFAGWLRVHRDAARLRDEVLGQAEHFDAQRLHDGASDAARGPWSAAEAPQGFLEAMLEGIVGLDLEIAEVVGRFKLSQNRTEVDRQGVVSGLRERGRTRDLEVADATADATPLYSTPR
ncbi:FMN-binding negative transcriptional regulator [Tessaracoccus caeni]|uniref:FMN-binding negative transcriptional regulator n=1 Tax=Tessaracoccus caeni TaxID=3031239 RepID=UPI0023DC4786|nr:FMN-binding negative transcriptional regulator [Tessaracoccus caeni]MDF1489821.1 FMN-binding negative transcriptional regulator [Tessaracoccus caeni]